MDESLYHAFFEHEESHWWFAARATIVRTVVERYGGMAPGDSILDIGCGTGALLASLSDRYEVIGIDPSPLAVDYARRRGLSNVYEMVAAEFPRDRHRVQLALLLDVIEHIDDDIETLRTAARIVHPGGRVVVTVPAHMWLWSAHDDVNHHRRRYSRHGLIDALIQAGLEPLKVTFFNTLLFAPIAAAKLISRARGVQSAHIAESSQLPLGNGVLRAVFSAERHLISRMRLPTGVSLLAVARPRRSSESRPSRNH